MKKIASYLAAAAAAMATLASCGGEGSSVGSSIVMDQVAITVDSSFTVESKTVPIGRVQSRTVSQLIGRFDAKGYGKISCDIVTQFMPASQMFNDEVTVNDIDSLNLFMYMSKGEFVGDSITPMGLEVYRLQRNLPSPIYSDFDPESYYNPGEPLASAIYNISNRSAKLYADTAYAAGVEIKVKMPTELGRELYAAYKLNPANFLTPTAFADNVFKGLYIKNSFGSGRLIRTSSTMMTLYYHHYYADRDTMIIGQGNYFAVTPEIITNNSLQLQISDDVMARVDKGQNIVMAPVGLEVQARFPVPEIIAAYQKGGGKLSVLNSLSFSFPAETIENEYNISLPTYLLMVLTKDRDAFFAKNKLPDNKTSFYATYNSQTGIYDFGDMRPYIVELLSKDKIAEEDYMFTIVPVSATFDQTSSGYYSSTQTLATLTPYMAAPVMGRLLLEKAKIKLTFSAQSVSE